MKKKTKKLALSKETLTNLESDLGQAGGGATGECTYPCHYSAEWTCQCQTNDFACEGPQSRDTNCTLCAP